MEKNNIINIENIDFNVSIDECFAELRPHPKFKDCTFDNYNCDDNYPSQNNIKEILRQISNSVKKNNKSFFFFKNKKSSKIAKNIYIDGTYGIGKTHLLSAAFNNYQGSKAFLSFLELSYFMNYLGLKKTIEYFKDIDLLLLDEFDLDDPAITRMVARFIDTINDNTTIITTSNRLPKELGGGKFDTTQFARELGIISNTFDTITVDGKSFRLNLTDWQANFSLDSFENTLNEYKTSKSKLITDNESLFKALSDNHPFRFFVIPKKADAIFIQDFQCISMLNNAIRFMIFIDHCYYHNTKLFIKANDDVKNNIFASEIMASSFERQFKRCKSRLDEIAVFFDK